MVLAVIFFIVGVSLCAGAAIYSTLHFMASGGIQINWRPQVAAAVVGTIGSLFATIGTLGFLASLFAVVPK